MKNGDITNQILQLKDGRKLAYAEYGKLNGQPIFYLHGFPGSRLEAALLAQTATLLNAHIISIDRPGMGLSSFQHNRCVLDLADDIAELADNLNIQRFAIVGLSGGGPYVMACAYKIPDRLTSASIISGLGPAELTNSTSDMLISSRFALWLGRNAPWISVISFTLMAKYLRITRDLSFFKSLPEPDQQVVNIPEVKDKFSKSMLEAFRFGTQGVAWEARILARPWNFKLEDIRFPIRLWHGELDRNVPLVMGIQVANSLPRCQAKFFKYEGHFSLAINHLDEIIAASVV